MSEDLQSLLEKINREGVEKARAEADKIIADAKAKAADIVKTANAEAAKAKADAEKAAADYAARAAETVRQAERDTILKIETSVTALLEKVLKADVDAALADEKGITLFLSSTQLYRRELVYITSKARSAQCPLRYRYHVGQYLPDWHPWESYTDFFLGDSRTNGIREILAIELPWLEKAFSKAKGYTSVFNKVTKLTTTYPDCLMLTLEHENGTVGQLMIDVVSRKAVRDFEVVGEDLYIHWGGTPASLVERNTISHKDIAVETYQDVVNDPRYAENIIENAYVDEIKAFFKVLSGKNNVTRHTFTDDKRILELIDSIEGRN